MRGKKVQNDKIGLRIRNRRLQKYKVLLVAREDEFSALDKDQIEVEGVYDGEGRFIVGSRDRNVEGRCNRSGFLLDSRGNVIRNTTIKKRLRRRKQVAMKLRWVGRRVYKNKQERQGSPLNSRSLQFKENVRLRSRSPGSANADEDDDISDVDPKQFYAHYKYESTEITLKAEKDRDRLSRMLEISKQMRKYDLKKIKKQEIEDLNLNIGNLKGEWNRLKRSLHDKSKFVEKIQKRHKEEV